MEQYLEKGKEVLKILLNNGCEAYMIGSCVCNTILEIPFKEIEITTNATPDMIKGIFQLAKVEDEAEGAVRLYYSGYQFLVKTFRLEEKYKDNRKPIRIHYSKNLHDDLASRDFTINAIAMSHGGKLTDAYGGFEDIQRKKVRTIGNPKIRFAEDPLRMLTSIRFVSELRFRIDRKVLNAIQRKRRLLKKISITSMFEEIKRIISGKFFKKALVYLYDTKLYKHIPILAKEFKRLAQNYRPESIDTFVACAFVLNGGYAVDWEDLVEDKDRIRRVVELALANKKSNFDPWTLFYNGLEVCLDANYVNVLTKKCRKKTRRIKREFHALPIHSMDDLKFNVQDILQLTSNQVGDYVQTIVDNMIGKILKHELANEYDSLKVFTITSLREMGVLPSLTEEYADSEISQPSPVVIHNPRPVYQEMQLPTPKEFEADPAPVFTKTEEKQHHPISKIDEIERRVSEYEKSLREKDQKIKELERQALRYKLDNDINNLVGQNLEMLKDMNYIEKGTEKVLLSRELKEMYQQIITNVDPKYRSLKEDNTNKEGNEN